MPAARRLCARVLVAAQRVVDTLVRDGLVERRKSRGGGKASGQKAPAAELQGALVFVV